MYFFFQAEDGIRDLVRSRGLGDVYKRQEFIKMILSSTGYSASSRVIRTADELMQQLMVLGLSLIHI